MANGTEIATVEAREVYSDRGHPGVEATVTTASGASGTALCTAGVSVGTKEIAFAYDGGPKWRGKGVMRAVNAVNERIAPLIRGMDATQADPGRRRDARPRGRPGEGGPRRQRDGGGLGGGAEGGRGRARASRSTSTSAASNAFTLPVPGTIALVGSDRYAPNTRSGGKPSYSFMAYGFDTFSEASYACWDLGTEWGDVLKARFGVPKVGMVGLHRRVPAGIVKHDREIWDAMVETINRLGYEGKIGIQVDVATETYWEEDQAAVRRHLLRRAEDQAGHLRALHLDGRGTTHSSSSRTPSTRTTTRPPRR